MEQDQEKPFKVIEVIDSRTTEVCKVACMSCIRGHRTTSCGIPACRSKVFWTVKRPGRPSNSCTCRFGPGGRCRCVVAKTACPHKPKRGEKRNLGCRCDEQGRFCCLLEPEHWKELCAQRKPRIVFYPSREALEATHVQSLPSLEFPFSPDLLVSTSYEPSSISNTPVNHTSSSLETGIPTESREELHLPPVHRTRFGMMGVGAPWGLDGHQAPDVLAWTGETPVAPRTYQTFVPTAGQGYQSPFTHDSPDAGTGASQPSSLFHHAAAETYQSRLADTSGHAPETSESMDLTPYGASQAVFDIDKLSAEYFSFQLPSAICQSCGMSGCTCKQCPATMQNYGTGSWANCCSKGHAQVLPAEQTVESSKCCRTTKETRSLPHLESPGLQTNETLIGHEAGEDCGCCSDIQTLEESDFTRMLESVEPMDLSEFLVDDLDHPLRSSRLQDDGKRESDGGRGCCCGDP